MQLAQKLYEAGKISYMRTDSLNLSEEALGKASAEINKAYGPEFAERRVYKTKNQSAQEAHEAIRPTDFSVHAAGSDDGQKRLYDLIWKRAIASQMADAKLEKTTATVAISTTSEKLLAQGEVIKFEGFLKVYLESKDDEDDEEQKGMLPPLKEGQSLNLNDLIGKEGFSRSAARYTEASLVKKLEEMGIGRPSTYAPTISTIQKRDYVIKDNREGTPREYKEMILSNGKISSEVKTEMTGAEKQKLFPTNTAMVVNDFLVDHFPKIIDFHFTANVEQEFDEIANGKLGWEEMLENFYGDFHSNVETTSQIERSQTGSQRELGTHPKTGKPILVKLGKFGAYVQLGEMVEGEEKPQFASLRHGQLMENITLEDALELFKLPRAVGELDGEPITAAIGRFGPYVRHDGKFASLLPEQDPLTITEAEAIELIMAKREADANKYIKTFDEDDTMFVLNGKYGAYIKAGKKNVKIPKDMVPEELTFEQCKELADKAPEKKGGGKRFAKKK
jgi:DNA topoisomerase-1